MAKEEWKLKCTVKAFITNSPRTIIRDVKSGGGIHIDKMPKDNDKTFEITIKGQPDKCVIFIEKLQRFFIVASDKIK